MWASILGGAIGLGSSIFGGIKSAQQMQKAEDELRAQRRKNQAWYDRRYNEDYLQTAEAQHMLTEARNEARRQIDAARGAAAVSGNTDVNVNGAYNAANAGLAGTAANIAAQGTARKDAVEGQYLKRDQDISQQFQNMYTGRANNISAAAGSAMQAGMGLVSADAASVLNTGRGLFANMWGKNKKANTGGV